MTRFFGGLLLGVGILVMVLSGLCSAVIIIGGIGDAIKDPQLFIFPLLFGGIPLALGFGMFALGRRLLREDDLAAKQQTAAAGQPSDVSEITDTPPTP